MTFNEPSNRTHCCECKETNKPTICFICNVQRDEGTCWIRRLCLDCLIKAQNLLKNEGVLPCAS